MQSILSIEGAAVIVALLSLIQISPLNINPWSWLGRAVGREINGEVIEKVGCLEKEVKCLHGEVEEDRAVTARVRILRFNDELLRNQKHSKDMFDSCLADIDMYEKYCEKHPAFRNNMTVMAVGNIKRCYQNCLEQHDFL